jgi:Ca2+-binding RTX toxin-like protein
MLKRSSKTTRPTVAALEARQLMTGWWPTIPDVSLTAEVKGPADARYVEIDGSDFDDEILITDRSPTSITVELKKTINGTQYPRQTLTLSSGGWFTLDRTVRINAKGGNDFVRNYTPASGQTAGGDGNDTIFGGGGKDDVSGGDGNDYIQAFGDQNHHLRGDMGNDTLIGSEGLDVLNGGGGNDYLYGGAGADYLFGDTGNDYIAGDWNDTPELAANDTLDGWDGNDTLLGHGGNDVLRGGEGHDSMNAGTGNDTLWGQGGDDYMQGWFGNDSLEGGDGKDELHGGLDQDYLDPGYETGPNIDEPELVYGSYGQDIFVKHWSLFGPDLDDVFVDYTPTSGDKIKEVRHW